MCKWFFEIIFDMKNCKKQKIPRHVIRFYGKTEYALECIALKQITFLHFALPPNASVFRVKMRKGEYALDFERITEDK